MSERSYVKVICPVFRSGEATDARMGEACRDEEPNHRTRHCKMERRCNEGRATE